jgi:peptidoglycan hydrolase-like protein with peptidoglycan-binding domain
VNRAPDVKLVQMLLNDWLGRNRGELLAVDGIAGPLTNAAIRRFQTEARVPRVDSRIDPNRSSIAALARAHFENLQAGIARAGAQLFPDPGPAQNPLLDQAFERYLIELRDRL